MDTKEIALRIGEEADEYADAKLQSKGEFHPDWHTVRDEYFAEALIAEIAKGNEPVCEWVKSDNGNYLVQKWAKDYVAMQGDKLYTSDQVAAAILKATKPLEDQLAKAEQRVENHMCNCEWRDIETAPKNGQSYLAYSTEFVNQYWVTDKCNGMTHWMPLPKAPASGASS